VRPLAFEASTKAIETSGIRRRDITHLVTVSCTGFAAPGFDLALMTGNSVSPAPFSALMSGFMGCHGALNGLRVARALVDADHSSRVLLCAAELCSLHFQYGCDNETAVSNARSPTALPLSLVPSERAAGPSYAGSQQAARASCRSQKMP